MSSIRSITCSSLLILAASTPAFAESSAGSDAQIGLFVLVATLCLFGFLIFTTVAINGRIDRLESLVRRGEAGGRQPSPLSWDRVLLALGTRLPLLGAAREGGSLVVTRPGLYLLGARDAALLTTLEANVIHQVLSAEEVALLYASPRVGPELMGQMLLSLEGGASWDGLSEDDQNQMLRRIKSRLVKYESGLFFAQQPESLGSEIAALQDGNEDLAAVLLDDPPALHDDAALDALCSLAHRRGLPVLIFVPSQDSGTFTRWQTVAADRFEAIVDFERAPEGGIKARYVRSSGDAPGPSEFSLEPGSGLIVAAS